jgi:hypothetical protein
MKKLNILLLTWYPLLWISITAWHIGETVPPDKGFTWSWSHVFLVVLFMAPSALFGYLAGVNENDPKS